MLLVINQLHMSCHELLLIYCAVFHLIFLFLISNGKGLYIYNFTCSIIMIRIKTIKLMSLISELNNKLLRPLQAFHKHINQKLELGILCSRCRAIRTHEFYPPLHLHSPTITITIYTINSSQYKYQQ